MTTAEQPHLLIRVSPNKFRIAWRFSNELEGAWTAVCTESDDIEYLGDDEVADWTQMVSADGPEHVIELRADGWTIKHPLYCRPALFECPVNKAAERLDKAPAESGRYVVELDDAGVLRIGRLVAEVGQ